jgi:hypothetical protein
MGPACFIWLNIFHRFTIVQSVIHPVTCSVCQRVNFNGFRYKCQKCRKYQMCQDCFWRGRLSHSHQLNHQMKEYTSYKSAAKQFSTSLRNSIFCKPNRQAINSQFRTQQQQQQQQNNLSSKSQSISISYSSRQQQQQQQQQELRQQSYLSTFAPEQEISNCCGTPTSMINNSNNNNCESSPINKCNSLTHMNSERRSPFTSTQQQQQHQQQSHSSVCFHNNNENQDKKYTSVPIQRIKMSVSPPSPVPVQIISNNNHESTTSSPHNHPHNHSHTKYRNNNDPSPVTTLFNLNNKSEQNHQKKQQILSNSLKISNNNNNNKRFEDNSK